MEQQAATYLFQQAPAVVLAFLVAGVFALAIRALFRDAKDERTAAAAALAKAQDDCKAERAQDRAQWTAQLDRHGQVLAEHSQRITAALQENTRATERLTDRLSGGAPPAVRAV